MLIQLCLSMAFAIIISAFCSLAEAVLYSLPLSHVEVMIREGKRSGFLLKNLKNDIKKPIAAILILNTIANTTGAAIAGASAVAIFGNYILAFFSIMFTMLILIFSEIMPKTAGVIYCKQLASFITYPINILVKVLAPIIWICLLTTKLFKKSGDDIFASYREIQAIATLSQKSGEIDRQEEKTIINMLELKNKTVRKVMTPRTVTFALSQHVTVHEANIHKEKWNLHSRVPVYDKDQDDIVGIVLRKDVLIAAAEGRTSITLETLRQPPHFVPETAPLPIVLLKFFEQRQHLFIVVDEYGGVTGIISLEDIIEEIMGEEIMDESDKAMNMRELAKLRRRTDKSN